MEQNTALALPPADSQYPSLARESLADILQLIRSENVGSITFFQLLKRYGTVAKALDAIPMLATRGGSKRAIRIASKDAVQEEIDKTLNYGAEFIVYGHEHYPGLLMQVNDPPPVLIARGHPHLLADGRIIAMVGSRNASANGCRFATSIAQSLGQAHHIVVSGLARGIDAYAHQGALTTGTIGVIAGGIDHIYPAENTALFQSLSQQGVIVTESPFGSSPQHRHFPARNRIIAGMSRGVLVVEATKKSGSLITATYGLNYNRDIFAVPGFPLDPRAAGTNELIRDGATLVTSVEDITHQLLERISYVQDASIPGGLFKDTPTIIDDTENLDTERATILALLGSAPVAMEELIVMSGVDARLVNIILLELELAGMITRHPGGYISRTYNNSNAF